MSKRLLTIVLFLWCGGVNGSDLPLGSLVPEDKQLDPAWFQSLTERGHPLDAAIRASTKEGNLKYIGMPVGGIGCGQLYLSGDGRLWLWDVFKSNYTRESVKGLSLSMMTMGGHYTVPVESEGGVYTDRNGADVDQGFILQIKLPDGRVEQRPLNWHGFADVAFRGEYPIGRVSYADAASPVLVELEAFSPFIPLNAKDSAIPVTVMAYTIKNNSKETVQLSLLGYLQNAVNPYDNDPELGTRLNTLVQRDGVVSLLCTSHANENVPKDKRGLETRHGYGSMSLSLISAPSAEVRGTTEVTLPLEATSFSAPFKAEASSEKRLDQKLVGSLGQQFTLAPGTRQTVSFVVSWYFPLHQERGGFLTKLKEGDKVNRHYKPWFTDAAEVARYVGRNFDRLAGGTRLWNKTWYDSTLPVWLLDRAIIPVDALATQTFHWFDNGRPWGWEGVDSCEGTCTHVWNYAQAMARLFPELERRLREMTDYDIAFNTETGAIGNRGENSNAATDGQAGTIIRTWREHTMSPDDSFLKQVWPQTKKAIEFLLAQDPDQDGVLEGGQANTLDAQWFGPMGWISSLYCASLRAGEQMALVMGDKEFASLCGKTAERGYSTIVEKVYDGEYFIHIPPDAKRINSGKGCHIDQVLGQSWACQTGLPRVLPKKETVSALHALWKYNVTPDAGGYAIKHTVIKGHRVYAAEGEAGMLMTTWPNGGVETAVPGMDKRVEDFKVWLGPGGYFDECMTGFEYQAATHMIYEGEPGSPLVEHGLAVARNVHDRYAPAKRNPYNEIECGDHYARAMASYGVFLAACGFEYNGPAKEMTFVPRLSPQDFRAAFTSAGGWGTFSQKQVDKVMTVELTLNWGSLSLQTLRLKPVGRKPKQLEVTCEGKKISAKINPMEGLVTLDLATPITLSAGQSLVVELR